MDKKKQIKPPMDHSVTEKKGRTAKPGAMDNDKWQVPVKLLKSKNVRQKVDKNLHAVTLNNSFAGTIEEESDDPICPVGDEWERLVMIIDSVAAKAMFPASMAIHVATVPGNKTRAGVRYTSAGRQKLPNLGEKRCLLGTEEIGTARGMTMQVANVQKALLSVSKAVDAGNRVVFDDGWSFMEDKRSGERTNTIRQGNLYTLDSWVKQRGDEDQPKSAHVGGLGKKSLRVRL